MTAGLSTKRPAGSAWKGWSPSTATAHTNRAGRRPGSRYEFVVGGYTRGNGARADTLGALLLGQYDPEGRLEYVGHVGSGFDPVRSERQATPRFEREKFRRVCDAAHWLHELLDSLSLSSFVKTTGRSGLHVFVPIRRQLDYDATRAVSQTVAQFLKARHPKEIALEWAVQRRAGEVFVDTNQNVRGKTLVSAYSPRATPEATVAVPLRWDEIGRAVPGDFTVRTVPDRLAALGDLWSAIHEAKADLASAVGLVA